MDKAIKGLWETIYKSKEPHEVSWTQEIPTDSLDFILALSLPKTARILDVGGGDSRLVDHLLAEGFRNITVLDILAHALEKAKKDWVKSRKGKLDCQQCAGLSAQNAL